MPGLWLGTLRMMSLRTTSTAKDRARGAGPPGRPDDSGVTQNKNSRTTRTVPRISTPHAATAPSWGRNVLKKNDLVCRLRLENGLQLEGVADPTLPRKQPFSDCLTDPTLPRVSRGIARPIRLTGHVARRRALSADHILWDRDLVGFGLRVRKSGHKSWIVQHRRRGKEVKVTLGSTDDVGASEARGRASAILAEAARDGLMKPARRLSAVPTFTEYVATFWADYARHWKASTQTRNRSAINAELVPVFGLLPLDQIRRADVLRWRDDMAGREGVFNRAIPVLAVMLAYAEQLGLRPRGSNPAKGTPRYPRILPERYLSAREYRRLATVLDDAQSEYPQAVSIIRLLMLTGARKSEIAELQWDYVQPPRLKLPDSKTGPKTIFLNSPAAAVLASVEPVEGSLFVFPDRTGQHPFRSLPKQWEVIRKRAALPDVRLHDLRHSFASVAINANISLSLIGGLLGHALPETTARYAHLADVTIAEAAGRVCATLSGYLEGGQ